MKSLTEDLAKQDLSEKTGMNTGQLTSFSQLNFSKNDIDNLSSDIKDKFKIVNALKKSPDGWYFDDEQKYAVVAEVKSSKKNIKDEKFKNQLFSYMHIVSTKYKHVIGIQFNGLENAIYSMVNENIIKIEPTPDLQPVKNYLEYFRNKKIDKNKIYAHTKKINDILHFNFGIKGLNERMIWTACILVAKRFGKEYYVTDTLEEIKTKTVSQLRSELSKNNIYNNKINTLIENFEKTKFSFINIEKEYIVDFLQSVKEIAEDIISNNWNGEDVIAIFFNEFTRYKGKSENGQVFTPDHITSLMYRISEIKSNDHVLDACCGSGSFLTKAMANMIHDVGGVNTQEASKIKQNCIFGIEINKEIFSLACANMLIHKDGKSNIELFDAKSDEAAQWIKSKNITKVLMNPPYEKNISHY